LMQGEKIKATRICPRPLPGQVLHGYAQEALV